MRDFIFTEFTTYSLLYKRSSYWLKIGFSGYLPRNALNNVIIFNGIVFSQLQITQGFIPCDENRHKKGQQGVLAEVKQYGRKRLC
ncbi:hypothetical protein DA89_2035 [Vibrio paracholerae]|nr:hypothetical protein DA89_2035 [Vibrio paracholerae]